MQAAAEGREPTAADKNRTLRDMAGRDPNFERNVERQVAEAVPRMQATMKAMAASLPAMAKALEQAAEQMEGTIDRATANMPTPGYPKR
jgi:phage-related minor tail protein